MNGWIKLQHIVALLRLRVVLNLGRALSEQLIYLAQAVWIYYRVYGTRQKHT